MKTKTALLAAFLLTACAIGRAEIFEQILVKVNGEIFTKSDLEQRQIGILRQKGQQIDLKSAIGDAQLRKALDEITPQLMVDVVDEMLLLQRGKELGYRIGDDQFKSIVDNIKKENKIETEEQFQAALKSENMTLADLRRNLEKTVIIQRVQQNEVMGKIGVTEDEARSYYDAHLSEFTSAPSVTLREILISVPTDPKGVNAAADEAAQAKAASEVSESPSKANSGLIGPLNLGDISPDLRKIIDAMKPGDVTDVIRTNRGYQILKLETKTQAETMPFAQAHEQIGERVFTDKRKVEYQKYLDKLRAQAIIEWKNEDIKRAFLEGLKQQGAGVSGDGSGVKN